MTRDIEDAHASLASIGKTLAELQAQQPQPKAQAKAEPAEPHEQLAAELNAAQSRWFSWSELAGGKPDAA